MSYRKPLIGFSLFAIASVLVTWIVWSTLQRTVPGDTNDYSATFSDAYGLHPGDDVRMAGVRVGRVHSVALDSDHNARVTFQVQRTQSLFTDTKAMIRYQNLIGQRYVALAPGSGNGAPLADHGAIPLHAADGSFQTEPSFDVSALLGGFEPLFSALKPDQINSLSSTLILALQGDNVSLSAFITQAAAVAAQFQQRDQILGDVIDNLSGVITGLAARGGELDSLINRTTDLVTGLHAQGQALLQSTQQVADATGSVANMVGQVQTQLRTAQNSTTAAFDLLIGNGAKLDQAAIDLPKILLGLSHLTENGAYANAYACELDISLYGVLFPPGMLPAIVKSVLGERHSEVCR
ncbi:MlaD family protein [Nocardia sp. NBC_01327]|uniref:MlaD family protein n=1 Tax=Nocardia sp. NBC_01327 TaxID=2903593 RepID=UPI002E140DAD|nr:MCE family protein [Nocardia sp. NBC_01327]